MAGPRLNAMIIVALLVRLSVCANQSKVFELIGMFTITDYSDPNLRDAYGIYPREAAKLAVEHVRAEGILTEHNYDLEMFVIDTPCDQTGAVVANLEYARVRGQCSLMQPCTCTVTPIELEYVNHIHVDYYVSMLTMQQYNPAYRPGQLLFYKQNTMHQVLTAIGDIIMICMYMQWLKRMV